MLRAAAFALLLGGCWGAPKPTTSTTNVSSPRGTGPIWSSPVQPFRTGRNTFSLATNGDALLIGSDHGYVTKMDLKTGKILGEKLLDAELTMNAVAAIADKRWLVIGQADKVQKAWTLDENLAATPVDLRMENREGLYGLPEIAVLDDGGVVITGRGLPLAIYDGKTLALRETLDGEVGWSHPRVAGKLLTADFRYRGWRFDLETKGKTQIGTRAEITDAGYVVLERRDKVQVATLKESMDKPGKDFPEAVDRLAIGKGAFVTMLKSEMQIRKLPGGEVVKRVELGVSAKDASISAIFIDGKRAIVDAGSVIRVVDLATGTISNEGAAPFGRDNRVALDANGTVLVAGRGAAWQVRDGKLGATLTYGDDVNHRTSHLGTDSSRVTLIKDHHVDLRAFDKPVPLASWDLESEAYDVWYGKDGTPVFDVLSDDHALTTAVIVRGGKPEPFIAYNPDATLWDVDVDSGEALVLLGGRVGLAKNGVPSAITLRVPSCDEIDEAHLEHGGKRAITVGDKEIAVWDRTSGVLLGAAKFPRIKDQAFLPGRSELVVALEDAIGVWSPTGDLRSMRAPGIAHINVSADGKRAVGSFGDGHVAVYDVEQLFGLTLAAPAEKATIPEACGEQDPFESHSYEDGEEGGEFGD